MIQRPLSHWRTSIKTVTKTTGLPAGIILSSKREHGSKESRNHACTERAEKRIDRIAMVSMLRHFTVARSWVYLCSNFNPASKATKPSESASVSAIIINAGDGALVSVDPEMRLPPVWVDGTLTPGADKILKEIGKQAIDQPGHVLMGAGPIWASRYLIGVPWYGWVITRTPRKTLVDEGGM
jgi:hypothetical protein